MASRVTQISNEVLYANGYVSKVTQIPVETLYNYFLIQGTANLTCSSSCSSWYGKYHFDFIGADGSAWAQGTPRVGTWTIQNGRLQSPNDGDSANSSTIEAAYVQETDFAVEFDFWNIGQGSGTFVVYPCCRYRCDSWVSGFPDGYYFQMGDDGSSASLIRSVTP